MWIKAQSWGVSKYKHTQKTPSALCVKIYVRICNGNTQELIPAGGRSITLSKVGHLSFKTVFFFPVILLFWFFFLLLLPNPHRVKSQSKRSPDKFTIFQWSYWCTQLSSGALEAVIQNLGFLLLYPVVCMLWKTNQKHLLSLQNITANSSCAGSEIGISLESQQWHSLEISHGMERINWSRETKGRFLPLCMRVE